MSEVVAHAAPPPPVHRSSQLRLAALDAHCTAMNSMVFFKTEQETKLFFEQNTANAGDPQKI
jgi:hypothetical protein